MSEMIDDNVIRTETLEMDRGEREEMMVHIYESLDAVGNDEVMINTEMMSTERQQALQHTGRVSVKNRRHRSVQVCLCLLAVLLFTAVIVICVYFNNERNKLLTHNYNHLKNKSAELQDALQEKKLLILQINNLTKERDDLMNEREELKRCLTEQDQRSDNFKWIYYNFSFYYISSEKRNWSDSKQDCEQRGANLVIINNEEEQVFVQKATDSQHYYLVGPSFWMYGYPRPYNHSCAIISSTGWANGSCDMNYRWICEKRILQ